jgi:hypothetical protein
MLDLRCDAMVGTTSLFAKTFIYLEHARQHLYFEESGCVYFSDSTFLILALDSVQV